MRQWEIELAEDLNKWNHDPFIQRIKKIAAYTVHNQLQNIDLDNLTWEDWDKIIEDCYNNLVQVPDDSE